MNVLKSRPWFRHYKENSSLEIPEKSIYYLLKQSTQRYGEQTAIIFEDQKITYNQLKDKVDSLAGAWKQMGFQKLTIGVEAAETRTLAIYLHWGYDQFVTAEVDDGELVLFYGKAL